MAEILVEGDFTEHAQRVTKHLEQRRAEILRMKRERDAAPELLAALKHYMMVFGTDGFPDAIAAIAKAEGGAP